LNAQAKQAVEETKGQLGAADTYFDFFEKMISSFPSGGTEVGEKLKSYAETNVASTREFIKQLSRAKDFEDALRIQTKFMHAQMQAFGEQTTAVLEAFTKSPTSAVNPPFKTSLE
jgi:hypothetical protein